MRSRSGYRYIYEGYNWALDVFTGRHTGLTLAEVEGENEDELEHVVAPPFVGWEVTNDPFFTGGALAVVTTADFRRTLNRTMKDSYTTVTLCAVSARRSSV